MAKESQPEPDEPARSSGEIIADMAALATGGASWPEPNPKDQL